MLRPLEIVVIRPRYYEIPAAYTDPQQRDLESLLDAFVCPVRRRILLTLGNVGHANVSELVDRLGESQPTLSRHLGNLKMHGLLYRQQEGQFSVYTCAPGRVSLTRSPGSLDLKISTPSGNAVTLTAKMEDDPPPVVAESLNDETAKSE